MELTGKSREALLYFLAKRRASLAVTGIIGILVAVFESLSTIALYPVLTLVTQGSTNVNSNRYLDAIIPWLTGHFSLPPLYIAIFILLGMTIVKLLLSYGNSLLAWIMSNETVRQTQVKMFSSLLSADYQFLVTAQKGDLAYRILTAPGYVGKVINLIPIIAVEMLKVLMIVLVLFLVSPWVTFFLISVSLGYFLITKVVAQNVSYGTGSGRAKSSSNQSIHIMNALRGIKTIRLYGVANHWLDLFAKECRNFYLFARRDTVIGGIPTGLLELSSVLSVSILVVFFDKSGTGILTSIPILGIFAFSLLKIMPSLKQTSTYWMGLMSMLPHLEAAYLAVTEIDCYRAKMGGKERLEGFDSSIEVAGLTFYYPGAKKPALKDISMTILRGQFVGIIGPSGSGKTTFLDLLANLLVPSSGEILLDGKPLAVYAPDSVSDQMGYVGQDTFLFNDTVRENILFGRKGFADAQILQALRKADALEFVESMPKGLDELIADDGMKMSGGQRQRLSIARAMLQAPAILLLDEATSALDYKTEANVLETILRLVREEGTTVIFVTHRKSAIQYADLTIEMREGQIVEAVSKVRRLRVHS